MLTPRLTNCPQCANIPALIAEIDCKITEIAVSLYNNTVFMLNRPISSDILSDLLHYRRILTYKYCNPNYAGCYNINMIASKVKLLIFK